MKDILLNLLHLGSSVRTCVGIIIVSRKSNHASNN